MSADCAPSHQSALTVSASKLKPLHTTVSSAAASIAKPMRLTGSCQFSWRTKRRDNKE